MHVNLSANNHTDSDSRACLHPPGGAPGAAVLLELSGTGFDDGAVVFVGGRSTMTVRYADFRRETNVGLVGWSHRLQLAVTCQVGN
jgi:hypothetical protein